MLKVKTLSRFRLNLMSLLLLLMLGSCQHSSPIDQLKSNLSGLRIDVPCGDHFNENTECHWDKSLLQTADPAWKLKKEIVRKFEGEPGVLYDVTLHIRGVVEPKNFTGGDVQFNHFQTGGQPVKNDYNFYSLKISDPAMTYTTNRHVEKVGHYTFAIDYTVTIPIRSGATVIMGAYDSNDVAIANHEHNIIEGLSPAPAPFDGQFFAIEVKNIKKRQ
jgi:hypothetical protein